MSHPLLSLSCSLPSLCLTFLRLAGCWISRYSKLGRPAVLPKGDLVSASAGEQLLADEIRQSTRADKYSCTRQSGACPGTSQPCWGTLSRSSSCSSSCDVSCITYKQGQEESAPAVAARDLFVHLEAGDAAASEWGSGLSRLRPGLSAPTQSPGRDTLPLKAPYRLICRPSHRQT